VLLILQPNPDSQKEEEEEEDDDEKTLPKDRKMPALFCLVSLCLTKLFLYQLCMPLMLQ